MKKSLLGLIGFFFLFWVIPGRSQDVYYDYGPGIEKVLQLHTDSWTMIKKMDGYRIQLVALAGTNSRINAQAVKDDFTKSYPDIPAYLGYFEPNFRVRAGNFRTRIDALRVLQSVKIQFPGAFVVRDKIYFSDL